MISVNQEIGTSVPEKLNKVEKLNDVSYKGGRHLNLGVKHLIGRGEGVTPWRTP